MLARATCTTAATLIFATLWIGCGDLPSSATGSSSSTVERCRVHHVPLVTVHGYMSSPPIIVDPGIVEVNAERRYPHFIPSGFYLNRTSGHSVPIEFTYCPKCEEAVKHIPGLIRI
jgi:hypothetical protein